MTSVPDDDASSSNGLALSPRNAGPFFSAKSSRSGKKVTPPLPPDVAGSSAAMYLAKCKHRGMQPFPAYYQRLLLFDSSNRRSLDFSDMHPFGSTNAVLADSFHIILDILVVSPDVRRVDLSNAGVNDEWAEHVAHATLKCPGITAVDLSRNPLLTDSAGSVLLAMMKTRSEIGLRLKSITLAGTSVSPSMANALVSAGGACGTLVVVDSPDQRRETAGDDASDAISTTGSTTPAFLTVPGMARSWSTASVDALVDPPATPLSPSRSELSPAGVALVYRGRHVVRCLFGIFHRCLCVFCWEPPLRTLMWFLLLLSLLLSGLSVGTASLVVAVLLTHREGVFHSPAAPTSALPKGNSFTEENPIVALLISIKRGLLLSTSSSNAPLTESVPLMALTSETNQLFRWKVLLEERVLGPLNSSDDPTKVVEALHEAFSILEMLIVGLSLSEATTETGATPSHDNSFIARYVKKHRRTLLVTFIVCFFVVIPLELVLVIVVVGLFLWVPLWSPLISQLHRQSTGRLVSVGHFLVSLQRQPRNRGEVPDSPLGMQALSHGNDVTSSLLPISFLFPQRPKRTEDAVVEMLGVFGGDAPRISLCVVSPQGTKSQLSVTAKINLAKVTDEKRAAARFLLVPIKSAALDLNVTTDEKLTLEVSVYPSPPAGHPSSTESPTPVLVGSLEFTTHLGSNPFNLEIPLRRGPENSRTQQTPIGPKTIVRRAVNLFQRRRASTLVSRLVSEVERQEKQDRDRYSFALNPLQQRTAISSFLEVPSLAKESSADASETATVATLVVELWRSGSGDLQVESASQTIEGLQYTPHRPHLMVRPPSICVSTPGDWDATPPPHDDLADDGFVFTSSGAGSVPAPQKAVPEGKPTRQQQKTNTPSSVQQQSPRMRRKTPTSPKASKVVGRKLRL